MRRIGIAHDHRGEGVVLHFAEQMQAVEALQIIEAIAVLQLFHLHFEHKVEGRAEHAAERHDRFGQAADPEIDIVEAAKRAQRTANGVGARSVQEVLRVDRHDEFGGRELADPGSGDQRQRRVALPCNRGLPSDQRVSAISCDEVDDRRFVLEVAREIDPAFIGLEQNIVVCRLVELAPRCIQRRHTGVPAAGQVDGREVERQAEEIVAQCAGDEFVDLVAGLPRHAADDGASRYIGVDGRARAVVLELERVQEALDQADMVFRESRIEAVDQLGQHRVAEAIDDMRELGHDRRIDGDVEPVGNEEHVDVRLDLAGELFEDEMLILHLGAELRSLEQAFAVPNECSQPCRGRGDGRQIWQIGCQPFIDEGQVVGRQYDFLGVLDKPVVLGMEDVVDGRQADILVGAAVAGDEMRIEQFVVINERLR